MGVQWVICDRLRRLANTLRVGREPLLAPVPPAQFEGGFATESEASRHALNLRKAGFNTYVRKTSN